MSGQTPKPSWSRGGRGARDRGATLALVLLCGAALMAVTGCATIANGKRARFQLESRPNGARVLIDGAYAGVTPLATDLPRKRSHRVQIEFRDGQRFDIRFERHISGWFWANLLAGPVWGGVLMIVDAAVGAMHSLRPRELTAWGRMMLYDGGDRIFVRVYRCLPRGASPSPLVPERAALDPDAHGRWCAPRREVRSAPPSSASPPSSGPPPPPPPPLPPRDSAPPPGGR